MRRGRKADSDWTPEGPGTHRSALAMGYQSRTQQLGQSPWRGVVEGRIRACRDGGKALAERLVDLGVSADLAERGVVCAPFAWGDAVVHPVLFRVLDRRWAIFSRHDQIMSKWLAGEGHVVAAMVALGLGKANGGSLPEPDKLLRLPFVPVFVDELVYAKSADGTDGGMFHLTGLFSLDGREPVDAASRAASLFRFLREIREGHGIGSSSEALAARIAKGADPFLAEELAALLGVVGLRDRKDARTLPRYTGAEADFWVAKGRRSGRAMNPLWGDDDIPAEHRPRRNALNAAAGGLLVGPMEGEAPHIDAGAVRLAWEGGKAYLHVGFGARFPVLDGEGAAAVFSGGVPGLPKLSEFFGDRAPDFGWRDRQRAGLGLRGSGDVEAFKRAHALTPAIQHQIRVSLSGQFEHAHAVRDGRSRLGLEVPDLSGRVAFPVSLRPWKGKHAEHRAVPEYREPEGPAFGLFGEEP